MGITARSYRYDIEHRTYISSLSAADARHIADAYLRIASDPKYGTLRDLAIAAYYRSAADRKAALS